MKRKRLTGLIVGFVAVCVAIVIVKLVLDLMDAPVDKAALQEQLTLARTEGIPTTWREFAATIKPASPSENAAPFYKQLRIYDKNLRDYTKLEADLTFRPSHRALWEAKDILSDKRAEFALIDRATRLPQCWFNRTWQRGLANITPELATMKNVARLVALRASVAASEHRATDAIQDVRIVFRIARHAEQEGTAISNAVSEAIFTTGIRHLAVWAYVYRDESLYHRTMKDAVHAWPSIKMQEIHRGDLCELMSLLDLSVTAHGRNLLGLRGEQVPTSELFAQLTSNRNKAMVQIVAAERRMFAAYGDRPAQRASALQAAKDELSDALSAYPTGKMEYLTVDRDAANSPIVDEVWECRRLCFAAIYRALAGPSIASTIKTSDLTGPFDGKPIGYVFDGRQMTITVSCPDTSINLPPLKFPNAYELGLIRPTRE